jgi:hypothetical protein
LAARRNNNNVLTKSSISGLYVINFLYLLVITFLVTGGRGGDVTIGAEVDAIKYKKHK